MIKLQERALHGPIWFEKCEQDFSETAGPIDFGFLHCLFRYLPQVLIKGINISEKKFRYFRPL